MIFEGIHSRPDQAVIAPVCLFISERAWKLGAKG